MHQEQYWIRPTLLTYKEIKDSYGSALNFFLSFGLKPYKLEDWEEAKAISRATKENMVWEQEQAANDQSNNQGNRK